MQGLGGGGMWFTLSLINAGLAESKGRGRFNWWLLSLLLGPLATFLIVVMPRGPIDDGVSVPETTASSPASSPS